MSYGKKVSSTYQRYACGAFLPISLYLPLSFQKRRFYAVNSYSEFLHICLMHLPFLKIKYTKFYLKFRAKVKVYYLRRYHKKYRLKLSPILFISSLRCKLDYCYVRIMRTAKNFFGN